MRYNDGDMQKNCLNFLFILFFIYFSINIGINSKIIRNINLLCQVINNICGDVQI